MLKLHILGHGAIGSLLLARARQAGISAQAQIRSAKSQTLQVVLANKKIVELDKPVTPEHGISSDCLLVCPVKAYQIESALRDLKPNLAPNQPILLMHNGMGSQEIVQHLLPNQPVFVATTSYAAKKVNGQVVETGYGQTTFGAITETAKNNSELIESINTVLSAVFPPAQFNQNIAAIQWQKLAINAVINPLTALNDITNGELAQPQYAETIKTLTKQTVAVMNACSVNATVDEVLNTVYKIIDDTANNYSSMHQDVAHNRPTEIDYITGFIVREGKAKGIDVSAHALLLEQLYSALS